LLYRRTWPAALRKADRADVRRVVQCLIWTQARGDHPGFVGRVIRDVHIARLIRAIGSVSVRGLFQLSPKFLRRWTLTTSLILPTSIRTVCSRCRRIRPIWTFRRLFGRLAGQTRTGDDAVDHGAMSALDDRGPPRARRVIYSDEIYHRALEYEKKSRYRA